ncbi:unnamed protein product [Allacma fusca]|uniref:Uncharacterized protein n=1 Tax=Allacma fusca TaxID=39272 RepID=A0A8J2PL13_9HEXA|nr:unnamed protein product [Allacma fusca]
MAQFLLLFLLPLLIISILYYKVGIFLRNREAFNECFVSSTLFEYDPPENSEELREEIDTEIIEERYFISHTDGAKNEAHQKNGLSNSAPNGNPPENSIAEMNRNLLERLTKKRIQRPRDSLKSKRGSRTSTTQEKLNNCSNCRKHSNSHKRLGLGNCYGFKARDKIHRKRNLSGVPSAVRIVGFFAATPKSPPRIGPIRM